MSNLSAIVSGIKKQFSKTNQDIVFDPTKKVEFVDSGNLMFNLVSGGGFPKSRLTEVFGMEHSCKTSLALKAFGLVQKAGGTGVLMDFENAWDPTYARRTFGLVQDDETFTVLHPETIEQGDDLLMALKGLDTLDLIVFDSVDAMKPLAIIEASLEDIRKQPGMQAMAVGRYVTKVRHMMKKYKAAAVFLNQMRVNIQIARSTEQNVGTGAGFNAMETHIVPGGYSLRFYASLRMKLEYGGQETDDRGENLITGETQKVRMGNQIKVINIKNKVGTPFLKGMTHYDFPTKDYIGGFNEAKDLMLILKKRGRMRQAGTKLIYQGIDIPEWSNLGSKLASEALWASDPAIMEDARRLVFSLTQSTAAMAASVEVADKEEIVQTDAAVNEHMSSQMPEISFADIIPEEDLAVATEGAHPVETPSEPEFQHEYETPFTPETGEVYPLSDGIATANHVPEFQSEETSSPSAIPEAEYVPPHPMEDDVPPWEKTASPQEESPPEETEPIETTEL